MTEEMGLRELDDGGRRDPNGHVATRTPARGTWRRAGLSVVGNNFVFSKEHKEDYYDNYTCIPNCKSHLGGPPIFIVSVTIIELIVFIYYAATSTHETSWWTLDPDIVKSPLIFSPYRREEVWRFLTYMLLHAGLAHILTNCFMQLLIGVPLELVHGSLRIMGIYLIGVVAGSMGSSVFDVGTYLVGASGGDFALMFAFLANIIMNWDSMKREYAIFRLVGILIFIIADFAAALYRRYGNAEDNVSYAAHLAGAVAGLCMGLVLLKNFRKQRWEVILFRIGIALFALLVVIAIFFNIFCPCYDAY